jgi:glycosyltransferase involved in cell wall biosynthesis
MTRENPLVSVIVRTKDRPKLVKNTLKSIAQQSYRPIEVVLVNDGGCELYIEELKGILTNLSLNYIRLEQNTGRAHAGNVGIDNANGAYIGFLDDDDEYHSEHIETLVNSLRNGEYTIVYNAVEFIEKTFQDDEFHSMNTRKLVFSRDFSYDDLIISNFIPLMALLFQAHLLKSLKFDESFELYEDWDMLIRAGEKTRFHFINKITAYYNQWSNSQIAFKSTHEIIRKETIKLYTKHHDKIPLGLIFDMREENTRKDKVIMEKDEYIKKLEARIEDPEKFLREKNNNYMSNIQSGIGWRLLKNYYKLKARILHLIH